MSARQKDRLLTGRSNTSNSNLSALGAQDSARQRSARGQQLSSRGMQQISARSNSSARLPTQPQSQTGYQYQPQSSRRTSRTNKDNDDNDENDCQQRPSTTPNTGRSQQMSARNHMFSAPSPNRSRPGTSTSTSGGATDPEEFLAKMRATKALEAREKALAEVDALQGYNPYSRPKVSVSQPLRSCFLDPKVNNIPKSETRSELMRKIKATNIPHHSFDIDGDGYVSQEDLLLGKRFDLDGNGVLDPDEQEVGRRIIAEEFFKAHRHDLDLFGDEYQDKSENENIDRVAKSHTFTKIMNGLKEKEKHYRDR